MTHNLDDLAKLAPFTLHGREVPWAEAGGQWIGLHALVAIANEWAELRAYRERTEAALRDLSAAVAWTQFVKGKMHRTGLWRDPAPKEAK